MRILCLSYLFPYLRIAGNKYYYNTANGESSWQIPGAKDEVIYSYIIGILHYNLP